MGVEVERKYRVISHGGMELPPGREIVQGYLGGPGATVRIRLVEGRAILAIKVKLPDGSTHESGALARQEFEYEIPIEDARAILAAVPRKIEKTRHVLENGIELDIFHGEHEGFILAEYESPDGAQAPVTPGIEWVEVTDDPRYSNAWMAANGIPPNNAGA